MNALWAYDEYGRRIIPPDVGRDEANRALAERQAADQDPARRGIYAVAKALGADPGASDLIATGLNFVPVVGEGMDVSDAITEARQGNWLGAGISALAATAPFIPGVVAKGLIKGGKKGKKVAKAVAEGASKAKATKKADELIKKYKSGQIMGAPAGVKNARQEAARRAKYMTKMEAGKEFRGWYDKAGKANAFHMGDDKLRTARFTGSQSILSGQDVVRSNLGHTIKANNLAEAGLPVRAGRFPNIYEPTLTDVFNAPDPEMVERIMATNKKGPFHYNLMRGAGMPSPNDPKRAVHDFLDSQAWGYTAPDGSPFKATPGPAQHRWMDRQTAKVIEEANAQRLGGFDDWDHRSAQAAAWTEQQIENAGKRTADTGKDFSDYWKGFYGQGSWEAVPGRTLSGTEAMRNAPLQTRVEHMDRVAEVLLDPQGRDKIYKALGLPTGPAVRGPGVFEGNINPGVQSQVALGAEGGRLAGGVVDAGSERLMNTAERIRGALLGQDAAAWHLPGNPGATRAKTGFVDLDLGGPIGNDQMRDLIRRTEDRFGGNVGPLPTESGVRLGLFGDTDPEAFAKGSQEIAKEIGAAKPQLRPSLGGGYMENNWATSRSGQAYLTGIEADAIPAFREKFNSIVPDMAEALNRIDAEAYAKLGAGAPEDLMRLREVMKGGFDAVMAAIKDGTLPVAAGLLVMSMMDRLGAGQPSGDAGRS